MSIAKDAIKGNKVALIQLLEDNKIKLYKIAKSILKNDDDACDALQEALISIYKNINTLKQEQYFKTWITRITINKCYDVINKYKSDAEKVSKLETHTSMEEQTEIETNVLEQTELQKALNLLDEDLKVVTILFYYNDLSIKEISIAMDLPAGTVKSRLSRSREKLYELLQSKGGEEDNGQKRHLYNTKVETR